MSQSTKSTTAAIHKTCKAKPAPNRIKTISNPISSNKELPPETEVKQGPFRLGLVLSVDPAVHISSQLGSAQTKIGCDPIACAEPEPFRMHPACVRGSDHGPRARRPVPRCPPVPPTALDRNPFGWVNRGRADTRLRTPPWRVGRGHATPNRMGGLQLTATPASSRRRRPVHRLDRRCV
jgi:hypothetical protein